MRVKICGITKPAQGKAIAALGATALGFICVAQSPRYVSLTQIRAIVKELPPKIDKIGVFAHASQEEIVEIASATGLTGVQLHGDESPEFCNSLRQLLPGREIIKAMRIKTQESLSLTLNYINCIDTLLLDAYHPQLLGGSGRTLNWDILAKWQTTFPWFLAGGLTPENIKVALSQLQPDGIDLSSGLERSPGDKDLKRVTLLFNQLSSNHQL
ncbi:MAG: phosphoribosylanthranilate isomerase [Gomphosphaeria aponina SAG 52.96 = DSM 107014]|uniref:N-(5'-phosphoribosyl)anthranilate isomerase n=1 Tax=Gomphosphaeria aponina SAG 52.96 = DSM 107014 TaxID=1521640 RepID=A0A941JKW0_9CHRO|nr:phosphoribosylanthranilate isomerase [Gomphosphaeria aponina SAG 52.96 = DSM 107014]